MGRSEFPSSHSDPLFQPSTTSSVNHLPQACTPRRIRGRHTRWSDGYRSKVDIQSSAPHHANSVGIFTFTLGYWLCRVHLGPR
ncbi:hypothetical protein AVEN_60078-1 [Araneus ventricosus]|uniref:Uncharacterized protein n=1 Tax=Araneus ventricosus TaxID=182803 RepID=A0A4Y2HY80_ARAVE|nr:hypothetical protein AVEN_60078-1 [Araneus ventricosus]